MATTVEIDDETNARLESIQSETLGEPAKKHLVAAAVETLHDDTLRSEVEP